MVGAASTFSRRGADFHSEECCPQLNRETVSVAILLPTVGSVFRRRREDLVATVQARLARLRASAESGSSPGPDDSGVATRNPETEWIVPPQRTDPVRPQWSPARQPEVPPPRQEKSDIRPALADVLPATIRGARLDPGRRGMIALVIVAALAAAITGVVMWRSKPFVEKVQPPVLSTVEVSSSGKPDEVVIAVAGKVRRPGLVRLPAGSRVADAIQAAGGALPGVDLTGLNLARRVADGETIAVGVAAPPQQNSPDQQGGRVNLNTATLAQLDGLPGIGPALAQRIIDYRTESGGFSSVDQLREIEGIGETRFERLKDQVTL